MKRAILIGGILFFVFLTIAIVIDLNRTPAPMIVTSIPHTSTPSLRPTPTPQPPQSDPLDCLWWFELRKDMVGNNVCVMGHIETIEIDPSSGAVRIYLKAILPKGYRLEAGAPRHFYFFDDAYTYTGIGMDECVIASGILSINNHGILFMRLDSSLETCP